MMYTCTRGLNAGVWRISVTFQLSRSTLCTASVGHALLLQSPGCVTALSSTSSYSEQWTDDRWTRTQCEDAVPPRWDPEGSDEADGDRQPSVARVESPLAFHGRLAEDFRWMIVLGRERIFGAAQLMPSVTKDVLFYFSNGVLL